MSHNTSKRTFDSLTEANGTEPPSKKPRANDPRLLDTIRALPIETAQSLLYSICIQNPSLYLAVHNAHKSHVAKLAVRPPVNFGHYSKECWYTLNKKYARMGPSQQVDMMGDIMGELSDARTAIMEEAGPEMRFETRRNALEVLRKICKSVMLCNEREIRHELVKDGVMLREFAESMRKLAMRMTKEERERYKEEGLYEKLVELRGELKGIDMEGLADVYAIFDGEGEDKEENDNEDDSS